MEGKKHNKSIFVKGLDYYWNKAKIEEIFWDFGEIKSSFIVKKDGQSIGRASITFFTWEAAEEAIKEMNGKRIEGRTLTV